jgi:IPT/TIG domain
VLTVTGSSFTGTKGVTIGGVKAKYKVVSDTSLSVTVPANAVTGTVAVTTAAGTTTSTSSLSVDPTLKSFSPAAAAVGAKVTLAGSGLGASGDTRTVKVDGVLATTVTWVSPAKVTFVVPAGAVTGTVSIAVGGGIEADSAKSLKVPPEITGFASASASIGDSVEVDGSGLNDTPSVYFGKLEVSPASVASDGSSLTVTVPAGAVTGVVKVVTSGGSATSHAKLLVPPTIAHVNPASAAPGATVTITGTALVGITRVTIGGVRATLQKGGNSTSVTVTVPRAAVTGSILVTTAGGTADGGTFTVTCRSPRRRPRAGANRSPPTVQTRRPSRRRGRAR